VLARGRRVAVLEVLADVGVGSVQRADRSGYRLERPPGAGEWWVAEPDGREVGTLTRCSALGERFRMSLDGLDVEVVPVGSVWRRRWEVQDHERRALVEVVQRRWSRPVHEVNIRAGDLPRALPLVVAWTLALATSPPPAVTRRPRWTTDQV